MSEAYRSPRYVNEGDSVFAPFPTREHPRQGLHCKVEVAAGSHARVVNESYGFAQWFHLDDLRVPEGDPRA